jgi:hypothetical protein
MNSFCAANITKKIFVFAGALSIWPVAASAQVKVLMSSGFTGAYRQLLPEFEHTSEIKVATGSGSSQGSGPQAIGAQLPAVYPPAIRSAPISSVRPSLERITTSPERTYPSAWLFVRGPRGPT